MATIDKMWIHDYGDFHELRIWALSHYPELIQYFIGDSLFYNQDEFEKRISDSARYHFNAYQNQWKKVSSDGTINAAIAYFVSQGYSPEIASLEAHKYYDDYRLSLNDIIETTTIAILNTPCKVDRKLKWICPVECIREYLRKQCGMKEHWYYKLFWRN